jgi:hypothetical protein
MEIMNSTLFEDDDREIVEEIAVHFDEHGNVVRPKRFVVRAHLSDGRSVDVEEEFASRSEASSWVFVESHQPESEFVKSFEILEVRA